VYPDYNWLPWKFSKCPNKFWDDVKNQRKFMDWAAEQLNVNKMTDWQNVKESELIDIGGRSLLMKYNFSMYRILTRVYAEYNWKVDNPAFEKFMNSSGKKAQRLLKAVLKTLFPKEGTCKLFIV
jgi:hypothetical protein